MVSARWTLAVASRVEHGQPDGGVPSSGTHGRPPRKRRRTAGGGPQRFFFHKNMKGLPWNSATLARVHACYREVKAAQGLAYQELLRGGRIATQAHRWGGRSFGPRGMLVRGGGAPLPLQDSHQHNPDTPSPLLLSAGLSGGVPSHNLATGLAAIKEQWAAETSRLQARTHARSVAIQAATASAAAENPPLHRGSTPMLVGPLRGLPEGTRLVMSQWHLPVRSWATWVVHRLPRQALTQLRTDRHRLHRMIQHSEVPPLGHVPMFRCSLDFTAQVPMGGLRGRLLHTFVVHLARSLRRACPKDTTVVHFWN